MAGTKVARVGNKRAGTEQGVDIELEFWDIQDYLEREKMERKMGDSLLEGLGFAKPPQQRVRHKVWRS